MELLETIALIGFLVFGTVHLLSQVRLVAATEAASENLKYATQSLGQMVEMIAKENNKYETKY